jgi:hypothetical protein
MKKIRNKKDHGKNVSLKLTRATKNSGPIAAPRQSISLKALNNLGQLTNHLPLS